MRRGLILLILGLASVAQATTVESYMRNREALKKYNEKAYYPAYQSFLKALEVDPLNPEIHLNLALTFEANEEWDKAEQAYKSALKILPENSPEHFEALFNLANVLGKQHKIEEALAAYQECLAVVPDSKEVKTNIELLWQGGGGDGQGENKDNKDKSGKGDQNQQQKDGQGNDKNKNQSPQDQQDQQKDQKKQPKPFDSKDLSQQDVKKILDEIKNQEQAIRAQEYERNAKEAPRGKDW